MKKLFVLFSLFAFLPFTLRAQEGQLIEQKVVSVPDSVLTRTSRINPAYREALDRTEVREITYLSDGLKVKGFLVTPRKSGKYPCIIYNRGGNRDYGAITLSNQVPILARLASWGYVVVASQYRGNGGSEGREDFGGRDVQDVLNLIPLLAGLPQADASRIGMYGWSRGGMMTYLALTKTDKIRGAIIGAAPVDLVQYLERRPAMEKYVFAPLIPNYEANRTQELKARSAAYWPEQLCKTTPILLLQGSADWRTNPEDALTMANKLYQSRHPFRLVFFEGGDHGVGEHRDEMYRMAKDWLDAYVRDRKSLPNLEPHGE
ncbi:MAG: S9 family peptidase [Ferruginibacter sp.]|nr:S9 family peptidase [Cytophagales bacterium]